MDALPPFYVETLWYIEGTKMDPHVSRTADAPRRRKSLGAVIVPVAGMASAVTVACVPSGSASPYDAGPPPMPTSARTATPLAPLAPTELLRAPFEDDFEHGVVAAATPGQAASPPTGAPEAAAAPLPGTGRIEPSSEWVSTLPGIWRIEAGKLCGEHARNHGIWLKRGLPVNARIEFDATSQSPDGDLKAEYWGDGRSGATGLSYTNATSYLTIFGGWHNKFHVLARLNEHGTDRQEIAVDPASDDPREKPVVPGQTYHFKVERADAKTVRWWVDGVEMSAFADSAPLTGAGHDHFGFNDWEVKVCFDNVRVVPLP